MATTSISSKIFHAPQIAAGAPSHLDDQVQELMRLLEFDAPGSSVRIVKQCFHYLLTYTRAISLYLGYQAGVSERGQSEDTSFKKAVEDMRVLLSHFKKSDDPRLKALYFVFFTSEDLPREHTKVLGIAGSRPRGVWYVNRWVRATVSPDREKCITELRKYLPRLSSFIQALSDQVWSDSDHFFERVNIQGRPSYSISWGDSELTIGAGITPLTLAQSIPEREIELQDLDGGIPLILSVPQKTPKSLVFLLDKLDHAFQDSDYIEAHCYLRDSLEWLLRYFAGVMVKVLQRRDSLPPNAQPLIQNSIHLLACDHLFILCLESLKEHPDSPAAASILSVFYRRNEYYEFIPKWHTELLQLTGQLSLWCQQEPGEGSFADPEVAREEIEKYAPTLADWLSSLGSYFYQSLHFFDEMDEEGVKNFSIRVGEMFVNIQKSGYNFYVNQPRPEEELEALKSQILEGEEEEEAKTIFRPLITKPLPSVENLPLALQRILQRLDIYLRRGEAQPAALALRDSLDYLVRYFAGVSWCYLLNAEQEPDKLLEKVEDSKKIQQCERLLVSSLEKIDQLPQEDFATRLLHTFYDLREQEEHLSQGAHTDMLRLDTSSSSKILVLASFCQLGDDDKTFQDNGMSLINLNRFLPVLEDWLKSSQSYFEPLEHHEQPPDSDGQTELIVESGDIFIEMVDPDYIFYLTPGSDLVPDLEAPALLTTPTEDPKELAEKTIKDGEEKIAIVREGEPILKHRVDYVGSRANSQDQKVASGYIVLRNAGGGVLAGNVYTTHASVEISPNTFRGNNTQIAYWVDESSIPKDFISFIVIKTPGEEISIAHHDLLPKSRMAGWKSWQTALLLFLPGFLLGCLMFLTWHLGLNWIVEQMNEIAGPAWQRLDLLKDAPIAFNKANSMTLFLGGLLLILPLLQNIAVGTIYTRLPFHLQTQVRTKLPRALSTVMPFLFILWGYMYFYQPWFLEQSQFLYVKLSKTWRWFLAFWLFGMIYCESLLSERLHDFVNSRVVRGIISSILIFIYISAVMMVLFQ